DFELASPCTSLGPSHGCSQPALRGPYADGGFWIGAEGMTRTRGASASSGRFLHIGPDAAHGGQPQRFVYQRAGAPPEFASLTMLASRTRIRHAGDEARITLAEADTDIYALSWFVSANQNPRNYKNLAQGSSVPLGPDHPDALWAITEENGSS